MLNQAKTVLLLGLLTGVIVWIGGRLGGPQGMVIALLFAGAMNFFSYFYSDKLVLAMYKARPVSPADAPRLYAIVKNLADTAGIPMPKLYIIPEQSPNAFATGRDPQHGVVTVTEGLLNIMDDEEIAGVIAHELGHIKNKDILIGAVAATLAGAIMVLANLARWAAIFGGFRSNDDEGDGIIGLIVVSIVAPLAALLIQMAISRSREYLADQTSAKITGNPEALARALEKLGIYTRQIPMAVRPETTHLFIANPLSAKGISSLFSTHPPIEERIARLRRLSRG